MAQPRSAARTLAERLRELRDSANATQKHVARALKVSVPLVSSWESDKDPKVPPPERITSYARLFATRRSIDGDNARLLDDLTAEEELARETLERDLQRLRLDAVGGQPVSADLGHTALPSEGFWHFDDGAPVTIVAGVTPNDLGITPSYTDPASPDYVELYTYADPDSLVELHGHIRAANADSTIYFRRADRLKPDDYTTHLVLLGGMDVNRIVANVLATLRVPVRPPARTGADGWFEVEDGKRFGATLRDGDRVLVEDVAHFCRGRNPYNALRTVTLCNGMFGRGTYGAVRALTDARFRDRNTRHINRRLPDGGTYSILARVHIADGEVITPDWTQPENILHEWSGAGR